MSQHESDITAIKPRTENKFYISDNAQNRMNSRQYGSVLKLHENNQFNTLKVNMKHCLNSIYF